MVQIVFRAIPAPVHPAYFEMGPGYLHIILFDKDHNMAAERAKWIAAGLPYEYVDALPHIYPNVGGVPQTAKNNAMKLGFDVWFVSFDIATDEQKFKRSDLLLKAFLAEDQPPAGDQAAGPPQ
jgi:hypothetical protein